MTPPLTLTPAELARCVVLLGCGCTRQQAVDRIAAERLPRPLAIVCAWCPDFDPRAPINAVASHGICPACAVRALAELA